MPQKRKKSKEGNPLSQQSSLERETSPIDASQLLEEILDSFEAEGNGAVDSEVPASLETAPKARRKKKSVELLREGNDLAKADVELNDIDSPQPLSPSDRHPTSNPGGLEGPPDPSPSGPNHSDHVNLVHNEPGLLPNGEQPAAESVPVDTCIPNLDIAPNHPHSDSPVDQVLDDAFTPIPIDDPLAPIPSDIAPALPADSMSQDSPKGSTMPSPEAHSVPTPVMVPPQRVSPSSERIQLAVRRESASTGRTSQMEPLVLTPSVVPVPQRSPKRSPKVAPPVQLVPISGPSPALPPMSPEIIPAPFIQYSADDAIAALEAAMRANEEEAQRALQKEQATAAAFGARAAVMAVANELLAHEAAQPSVRARPAGPPLPMQDPHRQSALARIKKELLVPQDGLQARVMELRSSVLKEKNAIEDQLNTLTQSQVLQARKAMLTLGHCMHNIESLQGNFGTIMDSLKGSQEAIEEYTALRQVYTTLSNIREARRWIDRFFNLEDEVEELYDRIQEGEVLEAYKTIAELNAFKLAAVNTLVKDGKGRDSGTTFKPYFAKIMAVTNTLVDRIQSIFTDVLTAFEMEGNPEQEVVFAAIQVVLEEADHPVLTKEEGPGESRLSQAAVLQHLHQAVEQKWASLLTGATTTMKKLEAMSEFVETMSTWEFDLLPALPAEYALKPWYIRLYHTKLVAFLKEHIAGPVAIKKLSSEEHMTAAQWIEKYVRALSQLEADVDSGLLTPEDMRELQEISALFQADAIQKMKQWIVTYSKTQTRDLLKYPVEKDPDDDTLFSLGPIEYFKFLQSQLKSMSSVSPPAVVLDVAHCCVEGIRAYQANLLDLMQLSHWKAEPREEPKGKDKHGKEKEKEAKDPPEEVSDEWKETRLKYLCAFINDTKRMDENTEQLLEAFQKRLPDDWHDKLAFEDVMGTFHDTADRLLRLLSKHLTRDVLLEAWTELFSQVRAEEGEFLEAEITATLQDYLQDVDVWLDKFLLMRLHRFMVGDFVETYLATFLTIVKEYSVSWGGFLAHDVRVVKRFWAEYVGQDIDRTLDPMHCLGALLQASELPAIEKAVDYIFRNYADCSPFLLEAVIASRVDVEKPFKKEAIALIEDRHERHADSKGAEATPSVFAELGGIVPGLEKNVQKLIYKKDKSRDKDKDREKEKEKEKEKDKKEKKEKKDKEKKGKDEADAAPRPASQKTASEEVEGVQVFSLAALGISM